MSARDLAIRLRNVRRPKFDLDGEPGHHARHKGYAALPPASALAAAREYASIVHDGRRVLADMIRATGVMFGIPTQLVYEDLLEQLGEAIGEAIDMYEQARYELDRALRAEAQAHVDARDELRADIERTRAILTTAWEAEAGRRLRPGAERPAWFEAAGNVVEVPF